MKNHVPPGADPMTEELALLGHDMRSAIADVLAGLALINADRLTLPDRQQLNRARATAASLVRYLEDGLTTLLAQTAPNLETAPTDPAQLLTDLTHRWGHSVDHNPNAVVVTATNLPDMIICNHTALDRVLSNLISNAITYSGGKTVHLNVTHPAPHTLCFAITDQGPGFPDDVAAQPRKGSRDNSALPAWHSDEGHGLGLSIAHTLAQRMGATLDLHNQTSGATATLTLPIGPVPDDPLTPPLDALCLKGKKVLIADDSVPQLLLLAQFLRECGADITMARDGTTAESALQTGQFDLALLDHEMPGRTGLDICKGQRDRHHPLGKATRIVILTAHHLPVVHQTLLAAGAAQVIVKPITSAHSLTKALCQMQPVPATNDHPMHDASTFMALLDMAGPDLAAELMARYQEDLTSVQTNLHTALEHQDWAGLRSASHVLIALSGTAGAKALEHSARAFNTAAMDQDNGAMLPHKDAVLDGLAALLKMIGQIAQERHLTE